MFYEIRVRGLLGDSWSPLLRDLTVCPQDNGETVLRGTLPDQAALHGVLTRIRDLGLVLLSISGQPVEWKDEAQV
jgi:hypothetical protein